MSQPDLQTEYDAQTAENAPEVVGTTLDATTRKPIYRCHVTHAEIIAHKLFTPDADSAARFTALLQSKGIPEVYLLPGAPFRASETDGGLLVEFE